MLAGILELLNCKLESFAFNELEAYMSCCVHGLIAALLKWRTLSAVFLACAHHAAVYQLSVILAEACNSQLVRP